MRQLQGAWAAIRDVARRGTGAEPPSFAAYGISTFTLKNLWAAFVGHTHAASVRFVLSIVKTYFDLLFPWH